MTMTNRQRVIAAMNFEPVDHLPHNADFTWQAAQNMIDFTGNSDYLSTIDNHISLTYLNSPQINIKPYYDADEFGVIWNKSGADKDIGVIENIQITSIEDFHAYKFPDIDEKLIREQMAALVALKNDNYKTAGISFSLFERVWTLMGMENTLCNMILDPNLIHEMLDKICERNLKIIDIALEYNIDGFHFGDDWGQQKGLIMGKSHWHTFIKPYLAKMYTKVKNAGLYVSQHSCGDIREIMDELYDLGLNMYQTFQPEIYTLDYAKEMKGKIAVWGAISTQVDLPYITPDEVKLLVRKTKQAFGQTGIIVSPTHSVEFDVPPQNIVAMIEAFME